MAQSTFKDQMDTLMRRVRKLVVEGYDDYTICCTVADEAGLWEGRKPDEPFFPVWLIRIVKGEQEDYANGWYGNDAGTVPPDEVMTDGDGFAPADPYV